MESLPSVLLKPGEADRVVAGHPWIYSGSVQRLTREVPDGTVVQVKDHRQRFLGIGFYNSRSKILVRMLSSVKESIDEAFFERRIREAIEVRRRHLPGATSYRIVNSESDFLSDLIVDQYADVLVVQISALGMEQRKEAIVAVLQRLFSPRAIVERSESGFRKFEGMEEANGVLAGSFEGLVPIDLNGLRFEVNIAAGHKTGLYLDQQVNYQLVAGLLRGGHVLDCFTFMGGFGLHAARSGAAHVHMLDQSEEAIGLAKRHAEINGLANRCSFEAVNVFDWLRQNTATRPHEKLIPKFDAIILDPPSFTRTRAAVPEAMRGYKEIHLRALKLLKPGGLLATFCCSHHVDTEMFQAVVLDAAFDARRTLRRVATFTQSPDHPVIPAIRETEYLKGFVFELVR